jgi:hypothetical protein
LLNLFFVNSSSFQKSRPRLRNCEKNADTFQPQIVSS